MKMRKLLWGTLALVVVFAAVTAFAYTPDRTLLSLTGRWAASPSQFVLINGVNLHLRDQGPREDPIPIILLHGTSASLHTWEGWVTKLAKTRRVISFDLPAFGLTGPAPDADYRIARYVDHVLALLNHFRIERAILVGNSLGGEIAWNAAVRDPTRVAALVLIDAAGYPFQPKSIPLGFRLALNPVLAPVMTWLTPRRVVAASVRDTYGDPDRVTPETIDRYYELTLRAGNRGALIQRFRQMQHGTDAAAIASIKLPTLIIWGGRDQLIPPENARRFAQEIANSELVIFDDLGHIPQEEDPAQTVAAALKFLESPACAGCAGAVRNQ